MFSQVCLFTGIPGPMSFPGVGISGPRSLLWVSISGRRSLLGGCRYLEGVGKYTGYTQECRYNKGVDIHRGRYSRGRYTRYLLPCTYI